MLAMAPKLMSKSFFLAKVLFLIFDIIQELSDEMSSPLPNPKFYTLFSSFLQLRGMSCSLFSLPALVDWSLQRDTGGLSLSWRVTKTVIFFAPLPSPGLTACCWSRILCPRVASFIKPEPIFKWLILDGRDFLRDHKMQSLYFMDVETQTQRW